MKKIFQDVQNNRFVSILIKRFKQADTANNAIIIAYYALLSILPLVLVVGNILPLLHIDVESVLAYLKTVIPTNIAQVIMPLIKSFMRGSSGGLLSFGAIVALWSASQLIAAVRRCLNQAYGVAENQNLLLNRVASFALLLLLTVLLAGVMIIFTFGQFLLEFMHDVVNLPLSWINSLMHLKWPASILGMFLILVLLYYSIPSAHVKWRYVWVGALVATLSGLVISQGFALYIRYFAGRVTAYGSIGTMIVLMFWLNFSGLVLMLGGVINATMQEFFDGKIESKRRTLHRVIRRIRKI